MVVAAAVARAGEGPRVEREVVEAVGLAMDAGRTWVAAASGRRTGSKAGRSVTCLRVLSRGSGSRAWW